ncbi:hypothetical protein BZ160_14260 [Pantoea vagans]|nr:hypothetical protein BZ160_14260 [Pantoea vagans]
MLIDLHDYIFHTRYVLCKMYGTNQKCLRFFMKSYVYQTQSGQVGYAQIRDGKIYYYPYEPKFNEHVGVQDWEQYFALERIGSPNNTIPYQYTEQELHDALGVFLSRSSFSGPVKIIKTTTVIDAGSYYARMNFGEPFLSDTQIATTERADETLAYDNIIQELTEIFRTVEPEQGNFSAYGNRIRELLIIACTEVEYLWKALLKANGVTAQSRNYTTTDYIWCLPLLKLNDYEVSLPFYPGLGNFKPFMSWNKTSPTQSLSWYNAYNSVKHDRGSTKNLATLEELINSIAAIHILLESQYGKELFDFRMQHTFRTLFYTEKRPIWGDSEICSPKLTREGLEWNSVKTHP